MRDFYPDNVYLHNNVIYYSFVIHRTIFLTADVKNISKFSHPRNLQANVI